MRKTYAQRIAERLNGVPAKVRADVANIGQDADQELAALWPLVLLPEQLAQLRAFLDAAAGEGLQLGGIDAAELFGELFGEGPKMARCTNNQCAWVGYLSQCPPDEGPLPICPQCGDIAELE